MDKIFNIVIPVGVITFFGIIFYMIYQDYKADQRRKHEQLKAKVPCMCGHDRWIHTPDRQGHGSIPGCHDFVWDDLCKCKGYRMDNLVYLEMKTHESR